MKVLTEKKKAELVTMLYNFDSEIIATANVVNDAAKRPATYEARKQLIDTLRELSETCRAFANILDEEVAAIQDMQRIASKTKKRNPILDELAE